MLMVNILQPGVGAQSPAARCRRLDESEAASLTLKEFVAHLVPKSVVEAMATNEILQIVVFSIFFGVAAAALGDKARRRSSTDRASSRTSC